MAELRRNPLNGQWVIVHVEDSWGPEKYEREDHTILAKATCQFCPGKELFTPPEIEAVRRSPPGSAANSPGWQVRIIPNKFPALRIEGNLDLRRDGMYTLSNGIGAHEVFIETPAHERNFADLNDEEMFHVIDKYQSRLNDLTRDRRFKYVLIFKNYGESAGTTVEHPHSQIIALPMVPQYVAQELEGTRAYYDRYQRCVCCDMIVQEYHDGARVIADNAQFLAFCPFASGYPFECCIIPREHSCRFDTMNDGEKHALGNILRETMARIKGCLWNPSYNLYIHVAPVNDGPHEHFHWHIEIVPKLMRTVGLERGTGFFSVPTDPDHAARYLREAAVPARR